MSLQDELDSKQNWTQSEINDLKGRYKRIHFTHFSGVAENPVHPKDDPNWVYVGAGRWKRIAGEKHEEVGADQAPEANNEEEKETEQVGTS